MAQSDGTLRFDTKLDRSGFEKGLGKLKSIGKSAGKAIATSIAAASAALVGLGAYSINASIEFETAFAGVQKVIDETVNTSFKDLEKGIMDLSRRLPQTATEIAGVAEAAGQLGIGADDVLEFTEIMIMLGDTTSLTSEVAATSFARIGAITGLATEDYSKLGSVVVALGNNFATTESEVVEMGTRMAGTANQIGLTEHATFGLAAAMSSVGISSQVGGSSMSRVMQKINTEVLGGGENLKEFAKITGQSAESFSKQWKDKPEEALTAFVKGLGDIKDSGGDVTGVLKELEISGFNEVNTLLALSGASDQLVDALDISARGWEENTALLDEAEVKYKTTESKIKMLKNNALALAITLGNELKDSLLGVIDTSLEMVQKLSTAFEEGGFQGLVEALGEVFADVLVLLAEQAPRFLEMATSMVASFIQGIMDSLPQIMESGFAIVDSLINTVVEMLPMILDLGMAILINLINGIAEKMPDLITIAIDLIILLADKLIENLPTIVQAGLGILVGIIKGIMDNLPILLGEVPRIINSFAATIYSLLPTILETGFELLWEFIKGIIKAIPDLIKNIPAIIMAIVNVIMLYNWWQLGKDVINGLGNGISSMVSWIKTKAGSIGTGIVDKLKSLLSWDTMKSIGSNMVKGLWDGINSVKDWILGKIGGFASSIMGGIKGFFGIKSPSTLMRDQIGKNLILGMGVGIEKEIPKLQRDINSEMGKLTAGMKATVEFETRNNVRAMTGSSGRISGSEIITNNNDNGVVQNVTIVSPQGTPSENARQMKKMQKEIAYGY